MTVTRSRSAASLLSSAVCGAIAVSLLAVAGASLADTASYRGGAGLTGSYAEKVTLPLSLDWRYTTDLAPYNPASPAVVGHTVYFAGGNRVYAANAESGTLKWMYPEDQPLSSFIASTPAVADGVVYVGALDGKLHALNADTGKALWAFDTRSTISASLTIVDGVIYFGSGDGVVWAIDSKTHQPAAGWKDGLKMGDEISGAPAVGNGLVYALSMDQTLHAIGQATGKDRWTYRMQQTVNNQAPVISDPYLFIACGNSLNCLMANNGVPRWTRTLESDIVSSPAVSDSGIFVATEDGKLHCFEQRTGRYKWKVEPKLDYDVIAPPTICGNTLLVGTAMGGVYALDADTGTVKWNYVLQASTRNPDAVQPNTNVAAAPVVANGTVYIQAEDGLAAFRADAIDTTPPVVSDIEPDPGILTNGSPPIHFEAKVVDAGTGVDPASVKMALDGAVLARRPLGTENDDKPGYKFDPVTSIVEYDTPRPIGASTVVPLADGKHTITVSATDWKGNTVAKSWSFTVDNTIAQVYVRKSLRNAQKAGNQGGGRPGVSGGGGPGGKGGGGQSGG